MLDYWPDEFRFLSPSHRSAFVPCRGLNRSSTACDISLHHAHHYRRHRRRRINYTSLRRALGRRSADRLGLGAYDSCLGHRRGHHLLDCSLVCSRRVKARQSSTLSSRAQRGICFFKLPNHQITHLPILPHPCASQQWPCPVLALMPSLPIINAITMAARGSAHHQLNQ